MLETGFDDVGEGDKETEGTETPNALCRICTHCFHAEAKSNERANVGENESIPSERMKAVSNFFILDLRKENLVPIVPVKIFFAKKKPRHITGPFLVFLPCVPPFFLFRNHTE